MIGIISIVSKNGIIGLKDTNNLPFDYPEDMKHFRKMTADSTVIMGRRTFESIGKPLPKRRNIIISSQKIECPGVETFNSLEYAIQSASMVELVEGAPPAKPIWLIGGASIYEEGMEFADQIVLTLTPDVIKAPNAVRFPWINPSLFHHVQTLPMEGSEVLFVYTYARR